MFEDKKIVERFLEVWRKSGHQRIGHLYGKFEVYPDVPLGIRAVVSAIYEPPQVRPSCITVSCKACFVKVANKYSVELLEDPREQDVQELASHLGLMKVCDICWLWVWSLTCWLYRLGGYLQIWSRMHRTKWHIKGV